jgi:uncharacterized protein YndB with AHSA1/START domain
MTTTTANTIERELRIAARPETVYGFLTDADKMQQWMGRAVTASAHPGGVIRVDYNGFDVMRGQFVECDPGRRVVFTWGWESLDDAMPPGASRVEFTLLPDGDGTLVRMVHSGIAAAAIPNHAQGWDMFLPFLAARAEGRAEGPPAATLSRGEEYGSRLNALLIQLKEAVTATPPERWKNPADGRTANIVAIHTVHHLGLVDFVKAVAAGVRGPQADFAPTDIDAGNAKSAREFANISKEEVIAQIKAQGPKAVDALKAMSDADLAKTQSMRFAGGAELSAAQVIEAALLSDIASHLEAVRSA